MFYQYNLQLKPIINASVIIRFIVSIIPVQKAVYKICEFEKTFFKMHHTIDKVLNEARFAHFSWKKLILPMIP